MHVQMPGEIWEYTPSGRSWDARFADDVPLPVNASRRSGLPVRGMDVLAMGLFVGVMLWFAHQFRTERVQAAAAVAPAAATNNKSASFYNCKLPMPGVQPQDVDGDPTHTQFHPYNYTVCDGVQVTLWSDIR